MILGNRQVDKDWQGGTSRESSYKSIENPQESWISTISLKSFPFSFGNLWLYTTCQEVLLASIGAENEDQM